MGRFAHCARLGHPSVQLQWCNVTRLKKQLIATIQRIHDRGSAKLNYHLEYITLQYHCMIALTDALNKVSQKICTLAEKIKNWRKHLPQHGGERWHTMLDLHGMSDRTLGIVGITLGIAAVGAQVLFPGTWLLWVFCVSVGFTLFIWFLLRDLLGQYLHFWYRAAIVFFTFIFLIVISVPQAYKIHELPDVQMLLVYPQSVAVLIGNPSSKVVHQPKYEIIIWNLNRLDRSDPLPIPTTTASEDYIRSKMAWGPNQLVDLPQVKSLLTQGDHLF